MAKTREIKKRIKAVANIRRITKTMQMIATSKFARAQAAAVASKPYTRSLFDLVAELAATITDVTHPLLASEGSPRAGKPLTLIITSDRGLCGPYNGSVLRLAMAQLRTIPGLRDGLIELVGKKGAGFLKFAGISVSHQHTIGDKPSYEAIQSLAGEYIRRFMDGEISSVRVVSMRYLSAGKQVPEVLQLLPFKGSPQATDKPGAPHENATNMIYEFSPDAQGLLDDLLPAAVKALLFQAFNDAIVSEHVARMVAMKAATDNAGKAGKKYTRIFNRARQSQITTELTEIISGAAALA